MSTVKLTPKGEALLAKIRRDKEENIKRNNGVYVPEPWYWAYFSPEYRATHPVPTENRGNSIGTGIDYNDPKYRAGRRIHITETVEDNMSAEEKENDDSIEIVDNSDEDDDDYEEDNE